ncbi:hypothetical protein RhiirB3_452926 [Rhizophagus irregularis]|nr:hypothetical protein RhiirB3_452926 [Rhizophagus irregularis]
MGFGEKSETIGLWTHNNSAVLWLFGHGTLAAFWSPGCDISNIEDCMRVNLSQVNLLIGLKTSTLNMYDLGYGWTLDAWDIGSFSSDFFRHGRIGGSQLFGSLCLDFEWWRNEHLWECKVTARRN